MTITKYTKTDGKPVVVSPEGHQKGQQELHKHGKVSAENLTDEQRRSFETALRSAN